MKDVKRLKYFSYLTMKTGEPYRWADDSCAKKHSATVPIYIKPFMTTKDVLNVKLLDLYALK